MLVSASILVQVARQSLPATEIHPQTLNTFLASFLTSSGQNDRLGIGHQLPKVWLYTVSENRAYWRKTLIDTGTESRAKPKREEDALYSA